MKMNDYIKLEQIRGIFANKLVDLGLKEKVEGMTDEDLSKLIGLLSSLSKYLEQRETDEEKINILVNYIIGLWGILIIDYAHDVEEL